jgi:dihydroflavonol-4-reductase
VLKLEDINVKDVYIITGASGHLGSTLIEELSKEDVLVRGMLHQSDTGKTILPNVKYFYGNITDKSSLDSIFQGLENNRIFVIHCAALVEIQDSYITDALYQVNVVGTINMMDVAQKFNVSKFVYVASVDAFKAERKNVDENSPLCTKDGRSGYAFSKAKAAMAVRKRICEGFPGIICYPSGIVGPNDLGSNHLVQMLKCCRDGKMTTVIKGGYDIVDVRDVANAILSAVKKAAIGSEYILSGNYILLKDLLEKEQIILGKKPKITAVPVWSARLVLPLIRLHSFIHHKRPLYSNFSLDIIHDANRFSHKKATDELGLTPCTIEKTIKDTLDYLHAAGK